MVSEANGHESEMQENDLVEQARHGRHDAFEKLVKMYEHKVFHLAYGFVQDRATADDLAQEIFVKVYLSLAKFEARSGFGTWLYRLAANHIKDHLRRTARRKEVSLEEIGEIHRADDGAAAEEETLLAERRRKLVHQALETLPPKYRMVLTLRDVRGLAYDEIAETLNLAVGTVDSRLHRARKMLQKKLAPHLGREGGSDAV
jgi:RNA polymerase sigma-70 factor (ECF subfamily)